MPKVRECGHLTKDDLIAVGKWKAPRAVHHIKKNDNILVVDATGIALATPNERLRIGRLTQLHGVGYPMASVILHFYHADCYPIIDFRALWSLGVVKTRTYYSFGFWRSYVAFFRQLADKASVDKRTLDKALWEYSKKNRLPNASSKGEPCT